MKLMNTMNPWRNFRLLLLSFLGLCTTASAGTITATVMGNSGLSAVFFSLPDTTQVSFDVPVESGFIDPCATSSNPVCSYTITELSWIPSASSTGTSGTVLCLAGTCLDSRTVGLSYTTFLPAGIYQFVVIANDSSNTSIQSVTGTLTINGDFQVLPEPSAGILLAGGFAALAGLALYKQSITGVLPSRARE